jgi:KDO2-lipid IV(A) lauroyltransferase
MVLKDHLEHVAAHVLMGGLSLLSSRRRAELGRAAARLFFRRSASRRRIMFENLGLAFPSASAAEIEQIAVASVESLGTVFFDFLAATRKTREELLDAVHVSGPENYRQAVARGKGVFLLSAHFGNWEIGALAAGLLEKPIASIVRPLDNALLEEDLTRLRGKFGNRIIGKKNASRLVLKEMRSGGTVAILIDQNVLLREGIFVPFFGRLAATSPSLALFQKKTDAAVVPVFCRPVASGRYDLRFERPILLADLPEQERTVEALTARYTRVTEEAVRQDPPLWLWMHNRWRTRPSGATG